ncbi:hypothetical protein F5884DRAFT_797523 [Xylogone sp. PMI_703]|nr:hypothetical protein F5884DRAFT_797523 [Xylogone sp. PMI_703]
MEIFRSDIWVDIPTDQSIVELIDSAKNEVPSSKIILEDTLTGKTISYGSLWEQSSAGASWLRESISLQPGQRVAILSPSCVDYVITQHSIWRAGGVACMINHTLHSDELKYALTLVDPAFVIVHESMYTTIASLWNHPSQILAISQLVAGCDEKRKPYTFSFKGNDARKSCAAIILSSGTTGKFKAVMLSHYNLVASAIQMRSHYPNNWQVAQREIFFPPLSHVYGLYVCATMCPWTGSYVCMMPRFELELYCRLMQDRQVTMARLVPAVAKMLATSPVVSKYTYLYLEYFSCSAAPLHPEVATQLRKAFPGVALCQTYGCSEVSGAIAQSGVQDNGKAPLISAGKLIANIELRFLDPETSKDAGLRGPGEIAIRSATNMIGYKDNTEATTSTIVDGNWVRTGDIGYLNEDDYLIIFDRLKDVIKVKGFQVSPTELEEVLLRHDSVEEAAVCGVWNSDRTTEVPRAFVVLKEETRKSLDNESEKNNHASKLIRFVAEKVTTYKQLKGGIVFLDELPRNSTGKILRRLLPLDKTPHVLHRLSPKL